MRAVFLLLTLSLSAFFLHDARAFPDGAPWGAANPAAEQDCAACHFDNEPVLASDGLVIHGLPKNLEAGVTYDLAITFENPDIVVAGFQLIAQAAGQDVGTFTASVDDVEFVGSSIRSIAPLRTSGRAVWKIQWHAPEKIDGPIDFYLAASAANDDGSPFGDAIHFRSYRLSTGKILVGYGIGPDAVGALSDLLAPGVDVDSLRYVMMAAFMLLICKFRRQSTYLFLAPGFLAENFAWEAQFGSVN
jgi:hypothetical protein